MERRLIDVLRKFKQLDEEGEKYLNDVPEDIRAAFFDNAYVDSLGVKNDTLLQTIFGDKIEDVYWFLYEFKAGRSAGPHIVDGDKEYTFNTDEDFYKYLETV